VITQVSSHHHNPQSRRQDPKMQMSIAIAADRVRHLRRVAVGSPAQATRCPINTTKTVGYVAPVIAGSPANSSPQTPPSPLLDHHANAGWNSTRLRRGRHATKRRAWSRDCGIVHLETLKNWERNITPPSAHHFPAIIRFLGYVPPAMTATRRERYSSDPPASSA